MPIATMTTMATATVSATKPRGSLLPTPATTDLTATVSGVKRSPLPHRTTGLARRTPLRAKPRGVPAWLRQRVIERDGGCSARWVLRHDCQGRIDPHHVWRKGQGGPDAEWNLTAVCRLAHRWIHEELPVEEAVRLGWLSHSWDGEFGSRQALARRQNARASV